MKLIENELLNLSSEQESEDDAGQESERSNTDRTSLAHQQLSPKGEFASQMTGSLRTTDIRSPTGVSIGGLIQYCRIALWLLPASNRGFSRFATWRSRSNRNIPSAESGGLSRLG